MPGSSSAFHLLHGTQAPEAEHAQQERPQLGSLDHRKLDRVPERLSHHEQRRATDELEAHGKPADLADERPPAGHEQARAE